MRHILVHLHVYMYCLQVIAVQEQQENLSSLSLSLLPLSISPLSLYLSSRSLSLLSLSISPLSLYLSTLLTLARARARSLTVSSWSPPAEARHPWCCPCDRHKTPQIRVHGFGLCVRERECVCERERVCVCLHILMHTYLRTHRSTK